MTSSLLVIPLLLFASQISSSSLPDIDSQLKSFWFNYINSTLNILKAAVIDDNLFNKDQPSNCRKHIQQLIDEALKGERWANQMIDSMGKPDSRILEMSLSYLGSYSECIDSKAPNFMPKYCLVNINLPKSKSDFFKRITDSQSNLVSKITVKMGTCVPSTCSVQETTNIITRISDSLIKNSSVSINNCYEKNEQNIGSDNSSLIVICVFALLICLVIGGTLCDHMTPDNRSQMELLFPPRLENLKSQKSFESYEKNSVLYDILIAFSLKTNAKKIFETKSGDNSIQIFHGIKVLSMFWIIGGHSVAFAAQWMNFRNPLAIREVPQNIMSQLLANGTFSVDCFFFISGFLVSYLVMKELKKSGAKLNLSLFYIHRYLRMTPSMMAIIAFSATLLQYMASGPQWTESIIMFNTWCQKNWWINALYLHNFVKTENMCLSHSWYSAVDMQFYLISPFILIPLYLKPVLGIAIALTLLVISMATTAYLTIVNQFPAVPYFNDVIEQEIVDRYYGWVYIKPYCRIGPYLVGILLAYAIYTSQGDIKIKRFYTIMGWFISFLVIFAVLFAMLPANNGNVPEVHMAALYSATSRTIWSLSLAWITFACITGNGGIINDLLSAKIWIPLSRLTHCAYLIHPIVMAVLYGSREQTFDFSSYLLTYFTISHIFMTYVFSFILSLVVESPFIAISKLLVSTRVHQVQKSDQNGDFSQKFFHNSIRIKWPSPS